MKNEKRPPLTQLEALRQKIGDKMFQEVMPEGGIPSDTKHDPLAVKKAVILLSRRSR